jgi:hypothetical protein
MPAERPLLVAAEALGPLRATAAAAAAGRGIERAGLLPPDLCPVGAEIDVLAPALGAELVAVEGAQVAVLDDGTAIADPGSAPAGVPVREPDVPWVLAALDFDARMRAARAVVLVTDSIGPSTLGHGYAWEIGTRARQAGVPLHAIVREDSLDPFGKRMIDLQHVALAAAPAELEAAAESLAGRL